MIELLTGAGLAAAAGLNAYIPLMLIGLASRLLDVVALPPQWAWLENEWVLLILGVLLVVEIIADKVPVVDSVNDWVQTVLRPTAGGLAFGSGANSETVAVTDPAAFFESQQWVPILTGVGIALVVHLARMMARPVLNAVTAGAAAPLVSAVEDAASIILSVLAIVVPILVVVAVPLLAWWLIAALRRARRRRVASAES
ncbi:DUF4126 domain-containing protein [Salinibacterium sp. SYSU T00001]|uniref:DUF4126 domain-containing protein n=1 Tax=Homoserinimonas sedimenticola TaxID=2986805 RepID=UPI002235A13D|nr:DUF4126 domain-containing protein [Salinibacterium sedimenticola]MCW4384383.1 DUF4126 domain-containing protein [Salinibacterium sedimenticola]